MPQAQRAQLISRLEQARGSRVICFLTSDRPNASQQINKDVMPLFYEHLREIGDAPRIDVFLYTLGGDTLAAFGLMRLLREFSPWIGALVPEKCYSAGTLFAVGANEILMTRLATLTPFDPSIVRPLNPAVELAPNQRQLLPVSVESVAGFKTLVSEDWNIKGEEALSSAFRVLADRVHPLALGDVYRSRQQIELLATKLLKEHRPNDEAVPGVINTLTKGLGSHDYLISRREARELLGKQIAEDNRAVEDLVWQLHQDFVEEMELRVPYDSTQLIQRAAAAAAAAAGAAVTSPTAAAPAGMPAGAASPPGAAVPPGAPPVSVNAVQKLAIVESLYGIHVAEKEVRLTQIMVQVPVMMGPGGMPLAPPGNMPAIREDIIRAGWRFQPKPGGGQPQQASKQAAKTQRPRARKVAKGGSNV